MMPTKTTVLVHLPLKSPVHSPTSTGFHDHQSKALASKNTTITTTPIPAPKHHTMDPPPPTTTTTTADGPPPRRRPSTLRKNASQQERRVKSLSVGHISPPPHSHLHPDIPRRAHHRHEFPDRSFSSYPSSSSSSSSVNSDFDCIPSSDANAGLQAPPQKSSLGFNMGYIARVANGLTSTFGLIGKAGGSGSSGGGGGEDMSKKAVTGEKRVRSRSRARDRGERSGSKSGTSKRSSSHTRPGTAAGILSAPGTGTKAVVDVDKPLPSRPGQGSCSSDKRPFSLLRDGSGSGGLGSNSGSTNGNSFGTPGLGGYSLLFVDHSTILPPSTAHGQSRPGSAAGHSQHRYGPPSASSTTEGSEKDGKDKGMGASMRLEPIIPVHVLEEMVSTTTSSGVTSFVTSPVEMSPAHAQLHGYAEGSGAMSPGGVRGMEAGSLRRRGRRDGSQTRMHESGGGVDLEDHTLSLAQDTERARSLSRSNSTIRTTYSRRPSVNSSLRREMVRGESVPGESIASRPGTSSGTASLCVSRSNSTVSRMSEAEEEEERRGRGRSPAGYGVRRVGGSYISSKENTMDIKEITITKRPAPTLPPLALARKPVPVPATAPRTAPLARKSSIPRSSSSRSRSRSTTRLPSSRPASPECATSTTAMNTINEVQLPADRPSALPPPSSRIMDRKSRISRTPSPSPSPSGTALRQLTGRTDRKSSRSPAQGRRLTSPPEAGHRFSKLPVGIDLPTAEQQASLRARTSNTSLRAKFHADEITFLNYPETPAPAPTPTRLPDLLSLSNMPKRKPVPHINNPGHPPPTTSGSYPAPSTSAATAHQFQPPRPKAKNQMIVSIPPPLILARKDINPGPRAGLGESPISGGGKSTAGLVSSEDEEDMLRTPMTATFSYVTQLVPAPAPRTPSPAKRVLRRAVDRGGSSASDEAEDMEAESGQVLLLLEDAGGSPSTQLVEGVREGVRRKVLVEVSASVDVDVHSTSIRVATAAVLPPTPNDNNSCAPPAHMEPPREASIEASQAQNPACTTTSLSTPCRAQAQAQAQVQTPPPTGVSAINAHVPQPVPSNPASESSISALVAVATAPQLILTSHPHATTQRTPISPVSPVSPLYPTSHEAPNSLNSPLSMATLHHERTLWSTERQTLQTHVTHLEHENQRLKSLIYTLTEQLERQDMQLREQQQAMRAAGTPYKGGLGTGASIPQAHGGLMPRRLPPGWSVFTTPRNAPAPGDKDLRKEMKEVEEEMEERGGGAAGMGHKRGSISLSSSLSGLTSPESGGGASITPPPRPSRGVLRKGASASLPLLSPSTKPGNTNTTTPTVLGLSMSTALPSRGGEVQEIDRDKPPPTKKVQGEKGVGVGVSVAGAGYPQAGPATGRSPRMLLKRTAAAAVYIRRRNK